MVLVIPKTLLKLLSCADSFFLSLECSQVNSLIIACNSRNPLTVFQLVYPMEAGSIITPKRSVLPINCAIYCAKINQPVVVTNTVDVINLFNGNVAVHMTPNDTVLTVDLSLNGNDPIPRARTYATGPRTGINPVPVTVMVIENEIAPRANLPNQMSSFSLVFEQGMYTFLR